MAKKKTIESTKKQIYENSLQTCEYLEGIAKPGHKIHVRCLIHGNDFWVSYDTICKSTRKHHICPICKQEDKQKEKTKLICDYCGKEYLRTRSKNKTKLHFCCRACKDAAQRLASGEKFAEIRPDHYGVGHTVYRDSAFTVYPHKCAICGWSEDDDILEVHHIDENRGNGDINNLIILCPTCHKKLSSHKYFLTKDRLSIIKNK